MCIQGKITFTGTDAQLVGYGEVNKAQASKGGWSWEESKERRKAQTSFLRFRKHACASCRCCFVVRPPLTLGLVSAQATPVVATYDADSVFSSN